MTNKKNTFRSPYFYIAFSVFAIASSYLYYYKVGNAYHLYFNLAIASIIITVLIIRKMRKGNKAVQKSSDIS